MNRFQFTPKASAASQDCTQYMSVQYDVVAANQDRAIELVSEIASEPLSSYEIENLGKVPQARFGRLISEDIRVEY